MDWSAKIKYLPLLLLMLLFSPTMNGQNGELQKEDWEELTKDMDYGEVQEWQQPEAQTQKSSNWRISPKLVNVIVISLAIVLLVYILVRILGVNPLKRKVKKVQPAFSLADAEEDITQAELDPMLEHFLSEGDFRSALRAQYLRTLRELNEKGLLKWKKEKTNFDYVRELGQTGHRPVFRELTLAFELVWYGERAFGEPEYKDLAPEFEAFIILIRNGQ